MDMQKIRPVDAQDPSCFWLRYSTQFTLGGRTHTIEMDIPVPVGASAEQREQLIREAEAGIEQLYRQIERRGSQRGERPAETGRSQETSQRGGTGYSQPVRADARPTPTPPTAPPRNPTPNSPSQQVAAQTSAREAPTAIPLQERREAPPTPVAPTRTTIGSEMPITHNLNNSAPGSIRLAQFIQIIKTNWGMTPKEAMDLLQVKTLNNMNYRDLLRQLESLVQQRAEGAPKNAAGQARPTASSAPVSPAPRVASPASSTTMREIGPRPASSPPSQPAPLPVSANRAPVPTPAPSTASPKLSASASSPTLDGPTNIPVFPLKENTLREVSRPYKFDEEEEELEEPEGELEGEEIEEEGGMSDALARIKVDELREIRGTAPVSPLRLTVLHNLVDSQISETQLQQLIESLWNINSDKKLKQDHVEALISWAKEDYFEDEVNAVLALLNG